MINEINVDALYKTWILLKPNDYKIGKEIMDLIRTY